MLDNIRRLTSNISFTQASSPSQSEHETSVHDETNEKTGGKCTDATSDIREMNIDDAVILHSNTVNALVYQEQNELTARSDVNISNHGSLSKEEDQKDPTNNELMERTMTHLKVSCEEEVMRKQDDGEKMKEAEVDIVHRKDVNVSDSVAGTNDSTAVMSFSSNCAPKASTEMASGPCAAIQEEPSCNVVDVVTTTTFISNSLTPECLDIPLLEEISQATDNTSKETEKASLSAETTTQVKAAVLPFCNGEQQMTTGALFFPEAVTELKVESSDVSSSVAEPKIAAEDVALASNLTTEHMSFSLDNDGVVKTNDEFAFSLDLFHGSNVLDDMVQSQCSSKSDVEDLLLDEICSSSDLELRLDSSSESPGDHQVSGSSSVVDLKKPIVEDVLEKSKSLLDVLREASKRELLAEASSLNLKNSICEDGINQLEIDAHVEEEEDFSKQQLHLSEKTISNSNSSVSEQTLQFSQETELLLQEKQFSSEPPIYCELHAAKKQCEDKMCKDEHHNSSVSFRDHCKENVLHVDQNSKPGSPISTVQSEDTVSQSKENMVELDSDLE